VSLTIFQIISLSVIMVGLLLILESIVIVGGKGIDINGELPFMAFGTLFAAGMPVALNLLGTWEKSWYWYIFVAFLMLSGFTAYIRSRGYTIRVFGGNMRSVSGGVEKVLKQSQTAFQKEIKTIQGGVVSQYTIGEGKYPIHVTERKTSGLSDAHVEIVAPEALWNKELQIHLTSFVGASRSGKDASIALKSTFRRLFVGIATVFMGGYLYFFV